MSTLPEQYAIGIRIHAGDITAAITRIHANINRMATVGRRLRFVHSRKARVARWRRRTFGRRWPGR